MTPFGTDTEASQGMLIESTPLAQAQKGKK